MTDERLRRVEQACTDLVGAGEEVTFDAVASRAGIGRATLYRRPELKALVHDHRTQATEASTLTGLTVQLDQLRRSVEAIADKVRRHEEILRKLTGRPRAPKA
jgi:AcrR family transcriptional regulator